jgi:hypothetical protein
MLTGRGTSAGNKKLCVKDAVWEAIEYNEVAIDLNISSCWPLEV